MSRKCIQMSRDYRQFKRSDENRPVDLPGHKKLEESMKRYGFIPSLHIIVRTDPATGVKVFKDGQHRFAFAEQLGLPIYYVEEEIDFDIAVVNCTARVWTVADYAKKHSANGVPGYQEAIDFAGAYGLPLGKAFALLAGTTSFTNCRDAVQGGTFAVKDRQWAEAVARVYQGLTSLVRTLKTVRFLEACMAVCRATSFEPTRLTQNAPRCMDKLVRRYSTKDQYLEMLEVVYNYGRKQLVPLKIEALTVMRERNAATKA